ncbi:MAG: DNA primase [Arcticibacterium sp.]|jgi:DNA primase
MIPQDTIQQILQASDVVDVVGDFVSLKKRGANMIACCPFHNEKTPSFSVSVAKQIYKCFGCGKGGDAVRFLMDLEGLSYPEALKWLAKKYGIEIQEKEYTDEELLAQNERESLFIVTEFAQKYYVEQLHSDEGRSIGYSYYKERGYNDTTIEKFGLGYSLDGWDSFTKHALKKGFALNILEKAGLTIIKEGKDPIDRFRGRVIFPINNVGGKPIAFGARILKANPKSPKYLNSPETDIYHKSRIVYGINTAKSSIRQEDNCFLVEGYTDVVSLNQAGVENVVASSGTSLTKEQIRLIRRFSNNITVLYDGDAAGINASLRGTDLILEEDMNVRVVVFPDGEDPDSYVQKVGSEDFKKYIKETQKDFIRFKTEISLEKIGNDPVARAGLISDLVGTITKIPDAIKRSVFYKEVALLLQIDEAVLINEGNKFLRKNIADKKKEASNQNRNDNQFPPPDFFVEETVSDEFLDNFQLSSDSNSIYRRKYILEEEFLRLIIVHCCLDSEENQVYSDEQKRALELLFEHISGEYFSIDNPLVVEAVQLFLDIYEEKGFVSQSIFKSNTNEQIREKTINWLLPPLRISPGWAEKEIVVKEESEILFRLFKETLERIFIEFFRIKGDLEAAKLEFEITEAEEAQIFKRHSVSKQKEMEYADKRKSVI